jgi:hypothetical protein
MQVFETAERTPLRSAVVAIVDRVDLVGDEGQPVTHLFDAGLSGREAG